MVLIFFGLSVWIQKKSKQMEEKNTIAKLQDQRTSPPKAQIPMCTPLKKLNKCGGKPSPVHPVLYMRSQPTSQRATKTHHNLWPKHAARTRKKIQKKIRASLPLYRSLSTCCFEMLTGQEYRLWMELELEMRFGQG
ncbi:predicted protein [Sclerotinia sclerotiorum 1980 UF-70]|uniref:Uncharacterized protein n=1 Tax=Sclerotinia sclerotiorum (strain ATCC 18683 / 1980 / Ss-1) TaxID=665079 RepID=A7ENE6_SCLS1|nr:predicted protein [Sclerotinia sclerotiorum 1980 UF-70]EDO04362.1 predicted protein [Sclerotinia sclerotiorum 1980 UF-70]